MARLVTEARQQILSTARESANEAVAAETRMLMADLHAQLTDAAKKSAAAAIAAQIEETKQETLQQRQSEREAVLAALREEMARELSQQISEARQQMDAQLAEVERARQTDFELRIQDQLHAAMQKVESATRALGASENEARVAVEQMRLSSEQAATNELRLWQEQMDQRSAEAQARLAQMDHAAKTLKDQIAAASAIGEAGWRGVLDAELESASERWREKTETLIEEASRLAAEKFGKNAEATGRQMEKQLQQRINRHRRLAIPGCHRGGGDAEHASRRDQSGDRQGRSHLYAVATFGCAAGGEDAVNFRRSLRRPPKIWRNTARRSSKRKAAN